MTHLIIQFLADPFSGNNGLWISMAVGAVALFGIFLPVNAWLDSRRQEREAFYKAETMRRIVEAPGQGGSSALELLREQERIKRIKAREGLKIGGLINVGVGLGLIVFLHALIPGTGVFFCGLIPLFIGVAMIVYVYVLASPVE